MTRRECISAIRNGIANFQNIPIEMIFRDYLGMHSLDSYRKKHESILEKLNLITNSQDDISIMTLKRIASFIEEYWNFLDYISRQKETIYIQTRTESIEQYDVFIDEMQEIWQNVVGVLKLDNESIDFKTEIEKLQNDLKLEK